MCQKRNISETKGNSLELGFNWLTQPFFGVSVDPLLKWKSWKNREVKEVNSNKKSAPRRKKK
jgi:hypothetical protein